MKKLYPKSNSAVLKLCVIFFITVIAIIYGCKKEISLNKDATSTPADKIIADAKAWYENTYPAGGSVEPLHTNSTGTDIDLSQSIKPDWQHTANYSRLGKDVIEMPVDPDSKFGTILKKKVNNHAYSKTYTRSSFLLLKGPKGYKAYIMTIVADSSYIKNDPAKLANNTYRQHDADFSGLVLYFTPKGKYVNGYAYKNGQLVLPASQVQSSGTTRVQLVQTCTDWYADVYVDNVLVASVYLYTTCTVEQDPGNSGSPAPPDPCIIIPPPPTTPPPATPNPPSAPPTGPIIPQAIPGGHLTVNNVPGGGGGFLPPFDDDDPCPPKIDTVKIIRKFCDDLTSEQKETILNTLMEFKNYNCLTTQLYNAIASGTSGYSFCISPGTGSATYNPGTKSINFTTDFAATFSNILGHELFHGYQDMYYPNGTTAYGRNPVTGVASPGFPNIEFEQAVFNDILYREDTAFQRGTKPQQEAYEGWLSALTNKFTSYPKLTSGTTAYNDFITQYNSFLTQFSTNPDNPYYGPTISLDPSALINLLNQSNCN